MTPKHTVSDRMARRRERLTPAEQRVAEVVLDDPEAVAFGTVATVAKRAHTSGPTVLRMAARIGFDGFVDLQAAVQEELAERLRPAAERIRQRLAADPVARALEVELENVHATLSGVDAATFERAVSRLAGRAHPVLVLSGEASTGVALMLADSLAMLRDDVELLSGSEVRITRRLATVSQDSTVVAIDQRRYDRWLLRAVNTAAQRGAHVIALTDSLLSPLAGAAPEVFVVDAAGAGPFDSHVGTLALTQLLVTAVSTKLRRSATSRLDRVEAAWTESEALVER